MVLDLCPRRHLNTFHCRCLFLFLFLLLPLALHILVQWDGIIPPFLHLLLGLPQWWNRALWCIVTLIFRTYLSRLGLSNELGRILTQLWQNVLELAKKFSVLTRQVGVDIKQHLLDYLLLDVLIAISLLHHILNAVSQMAWIDTLSFFLALLLGLLFWKFSCLGTLIRSSVG